jgi:hypothetical protein
MAQALRHALNDGVAPTLIQRYRANAAAVVLSFIQPYLAMAFLIVSITSGLAA